MAERAGSTAVLDDHVEVIDRTVPVPVAGAAPPPTPPRRVARLQAAAWALAGVVVLGVGYIPGARVPIIADDFHFFHETFAITDGSLWNAVTYGFSAGQDTGHANPVGQLLGALYYHLAYWFSATFGISPQYWDVLATLGMIALGVAGAASVVVWGLSRVPAGPPSFWPVFALLSAVIAATLQLHVPWSDDPVVSYGPAGWGSTALGLWTIAWALRATAPGARGARSILACSVLAVACVWYYEMLVAAIVAVAVALVLIALTAVDREQVRRRCLVLMGSAVLLPAVMFVLGRVLLAAPPEVTNYTGTTVALGTASLASLGRGMVSALPGGGWVYLTETAGTPAITWDSFFVAGALVLLAGGIGYAWVRSTAAGAVRPDGAPPAPTGARPAWAGPWLVPAGTLLTFWAGATATHAFTVHHGAKMARPGLVYLSYAVGVICVAGLILLALLAVRRRPWARLLVVALPLTGAFVLLQVALNVALADITTVQYPVNARMVAQSVDGDLPEEVRCGTLQAWLERPWPEYYREAVTDGIQENYERMFGQPFCSRLDSQGG
ncbi:hypothetical protein [Blastococcus sp. SYSU D01042]